MISAAARLRYSLRGRSSLAAAAVAGAGLLAAAYGHSSEDKIEDKAEDKVEKERRSVEEAIGT